MKISNVSSPYGVYNNKPAVSRKKTVNDSNSDSFNVSDAAKEFNSIYKAVMSSSDIREDKVNAISQQIENGSYKVSTDMLADKLLGFFA